jgi:rSAM/selenodomain-associated transferase 2
LRAYRWPLLIGAVVLLVAAVLLFNPIAAGLTRVIAWAEVHAGLAMPLFLIAYVVTSLLVLPAAVLTLAAGFLFGLPLGVLLVAVGALSGAVTSFLLGRAVLRGLLQRRFAGSPRLLALDHATHHEGFLIVLLARLSPLIPFNLLSYIMSLTAVRLGDYVGGTLLGMLPITVLYVYLGTLARNLSQVTSGELALGPASWALFAVGLVATVALTVLITRRATSALRAHLRREAEALAREAERPPAVELSVVIPVLDDDAALKRLLDGLRADPAHSIEIVVVSGSPEPDTRALCDRYGCVYLETEPNRGHQLHVGACQARGEVLWFLHADAAPAPESIALIHEKLEKGAESGCFRFDFQGNQDWRGRLLARLINLRVALGGIPYGDQGLFVTREAYFDCGGFLRQPLFEEVGLIRGLRARGTFELLTLPIGVATRRWERDGWWRRSWMNRWLAFRYMCGVPAADLARRYQDAMRRGGP